MPMNDTMSAARLVFLDRACPICGTCSASRYCRGPDYNWGIPGLFTYVRCLGCGLIYQCPVPASETLMALYPADYGTPMIVDAQEREQKIDMPAHRTREQYIRSILPRPGVVLDIGCGPGYFLESMRRQGWGVHGVESSGTHVAYARTLLQTDQVYHQRWPSALPSGLRVDLVVMVHVLEHFPDPVGALHAAQAVLNPGGVLMIETPNIQSWPARIFGSYWVTLDAPRHLALYSQQTLARCVKQAGFAVSRLVTDSPSTMEYTESLRYALGRRQQRPASPPPIAKAPGSSSRLAVAKHVVMDGFHAFERSLCRGMNTLADKGGRGCNLLAFMRSSHS